MAKKEKHVVSTFIHGKLRSQLRLFLVIFAIMAVLIVVHLVQDHLSPWWVLVGFLPGVLIGAVLTRTKVLKWNATENVVVGTMDVVGIIILVTYFIFLFFRSRILGLEFSSAALISLLGLCITAGAMIGRVFFTMQGIRGVLREAFEVAGSRDRAAS